MGLEGKAAIVICGSRGIGKGYYLRLAQERDEVVIVDIIDTSFDLNYEAMRQTLSQTFGKWQPRRDFG